MGGYIKFILLCVTITTVCLTILFTILFIALWQFKIIVGASLLVILLAGSFTVCVVSLRGNTHSQLTRTQYLPQPKQDKLFSAYDQQPY